MFIGRTDAEAETPILGPPDAKNWLIGKDPDAGKDWRQEGKGMTEDEIVGWHHWIEGCEFEQAPGVGDGQGGLVCCDSWGRKESDMTERLNWTELNNYTVEVKKRFKGLDLIDKVPEELCTKVHNIVWEAVMWPKPSPRKRNAKMQMVVWRDLTNSWGKEKWKAKEKRKNILLRMQTQE